MGRGHGGTRLRGERYGDYGRAAMYEHSLFKGMADKALAETLAKSPFFRDAKDPEVRAAVEQAIKDYHEQVGFTSTMKVELKTINGWTGAYNHGSKEIALNKRLFGSKYDTATKKLVVGMDNGSIADFRKNAVGGIAIHELAHGTYRSMSAKAQASVGEVYRAFMSDKSAKGWGRVARQNASEFYSEGMAQSFYGKADQYTHALRLITQYQ